jgi:WD40-like Beta Propeller Repeat
MFAHTRTYLILGVVATCIAGGVWYRYAYHTAPREVYSNIIPLTLPRHEAPTTPLYSTHLEPLTLSWFTMTDDRLPFPLAYPSDFEIHRGEGLSSGYDSSTTTDTVLPQIPSSYSIVLRTPEERHGQTYSHVSITLYAKDAYPSIDAWYQEFALAIEQKNTEDGEIDSIRDIVLSREPTTIRGYPGIRVRSFTVSSDYVTSECVVFLHEQGLVKACGEGAVLGRYNVDDTQYTLLDIILLGKHPTPTPAPLPQVDAWTGTNVLQGTHPGTGATYWIEQDATSPELETHRERLLVRQKDGIVFTAHDLPPARPYAGTIITPTFSPDGRFLFFGVRYYEAEGAFYTDLAARKTVDLGEIAYASQRNTPNKPLALYWSPDGVRMVLESYGSSIGYGNNALYASPTGHPKDLVPIFTFNQDVTLESGITVRAVESITHVTVTHEQATFRVSYATGTPAQYTYHFRNRTLITER